jgi:hypothetical protein
MMTHGAKPQLGLHAAEGVFDLRQHCENIEKLLLFEIKAIGSQTIDTAGVLLHFALPRNGCSPVSLFIFGYRDIVAAGNSPEAFLEPSDLLDDFVVTLGAMPFGKGLLDLVELLLKASFKTDPDPPFLDCPVLTSLFSESIIFLF